LSYGSGADPLDPLFPNESKLMRTSKPTRASTADLGVRPPSIPKLQKRYDIAGLCLRFNIPTVANGKVHVGAKREVDVYGLQPATGH
jgi:hypothetical protein